MKLRFVTRGVQQVVDAQLKGDAFECVGEDGEARAFGYAVGGDFLELREGDRAWRARVVCRGREIYLHLAGRTWHLHEVDAQEKEELEAVGSDPVLRAPMPGRVLELLASVGAAVEQGAPLIRVEAMKMEVDLFAPLAGTVREIHVAAGQLVEPEALLITLEPREP